MPLRMEHENILSTILARNLYYVDRKVHWHGTFNFNIFGSKYWYPDFTYYIFKIKSRSFLVDKVNYLTQINFKLLEHLHDKCFLQIRSKPISRLLASRFGQISLNRFDIFSWIHMMANLFQISFKSI